MKPKNLITGLLLLSQCTPGSSLNQALAQHWKKYDLKLYAEENRETPGPEIQGTTNPVSDAEIGFVPSITIAVDSSNARSLNIFMINSSRTRHLSTEN